MASQGRPFGALDMDDMDCRVKEQGVVVVKLNRQVRQRKGKRRQDWDMADNGEDARDC